jgi:predicted nuclease of predicted toxin-antitoxin system
MKLLFDNNISYRIVKKLSTPFLDMLHVSRIGLLSPVSDILIWQYAKKENLIIVTFDEDFETLVNLHGFPPKVILLRFGNSSTNYIAQILQDKSEEIVSFCYSANYSLLEIY